MPIEDFAGYFKKLSTTELFEIVENHRNYNPGAVTAAKDELANRKLTEEAVNVARELIDIKQAKAQLKKQRALHADIKLKQAEKVLSEAITPGGAEPVLGRTITAIAIGYGIINILQVFFAWTMIKYAIKDLTHDLSFFLSAVGPFIVGLTGAFLFYKRKTAGWYLMVFYLVFNSLGLLLLLYDYIIYHVSGSFFGGINSSLSPGKFVVDILFYPVNLFIICKASIYDVFNISKKQMRETMIWATLLVILIMFAMHAL
ncbi:MAG TPA: hypothetical protein VG738_07135 [Chitinophagaceae bacterium]|nr:hypothetical protein [Chitinophagaceae bacterium]